MSDEIDHIIRENRLIAENNELRATLERERKQLTVMRRRAQEADSEQAKRKRAVGNLLRELEKMYAERRKLKHGRKFAVKLMRAAGVSCDTDLDSDPVVSAVKRLIIQRDEARSTSWWKKLIGVRS